MATGAFGFIGKRDRLAAADKKITQPAGEYEQTMFFSKGSHGGILSVWEHRMVWEVFRDTNYSQHLDWNHPDCKVLNSLPSPSGILHVLSLLNENGWQFLAAYDKDNHKIMV